MELEKAGVVLYKDASSNKVPSVNDQFRVILFLKGGVTSSSLEVTAALGLDDFLFDRHMV